VDKWIQNKSKTAFINIIEEFAGCNFQFNWKKEL
jgi:hypothetical protein